MLEYFATSYLDHPEYWLSRAMKALAATVSSRWAARLERRAFGTVPFSCLRTRPTLELLRTFSSAILKNETLADRIWELQEHSFDRWVARNLTGGVDAVYTYDHAALSTLRKAARLGIYSFIEQPTRHFAFFERVHRDQLAKYPELANDVNDLDRGPRATRRNARRAAELSVANCIVCNSSFTKRPLVAAGVSPEKIKIIPLAFPAVVRSAAKSKEPVIFLAAGAQSLTK